LLGEVVDGLRERIAAQCAGSQLVGAGRASDAEVDAPGVQRLEHAELLGDHERGMVREHDPAGAEADGRRDGGGMGQEHRGR
jgi:hypothetical protein